MSTKKQRNRQRNYFKTAQEIFMNQKYREYFYGAGIAGVVVDEFQHIKSLMDDAKIALGDE